MIMKHTRESPLKESNLNTMNSKRKATPIKPYETELINNCDDLFKDITYSTKPKRSESRSSSTYYNGDKRSSNNYNNKKPKYQHNNFGSKKFILDQNDDDFQEIQSYINKQSKCTYREEVKKGKNTDTKYNNNKNNKYNKLLVDDSDDESNNNILKPYGIKNKGLKLPLSPSPLPLSSSSTTTTKSISAKSYSRFIIPHSKPRYVKEFISSELISPMILPKKNKMLSSPSPFREINKKKNSMFYASKNHYNAMKQYPKVSYNKQDDTTTDDESEEDNNKNKQTSKTSAAKEGFVLPEKRPKKSAVSFTPLPIFSDPFQHEKSQTKSELSVECPYCHAFIHINDSTIVSEAYEKIKNLELDSTAINHNNNTDDDEDEHDDDDQYNLLSAKPSISNMELYDFCRLHTSELSIKPYCIKKGWPVTILFDELEERIHEFKGDLDKIIYQKMDSYYRTIALEAYQEMGKHKARSTMGMLFRFEETMPGYYGAKGSYVMQNILVKMYLHKGILNKELTSPQLPIEYIQQVLVPEVGYRLIRDDLIKNGKHKPNDPNINEEAKKIMAKSSEAGSYLHPLTDDIDEMDLIDDSYSVLNILSGSTDEEKFGGDDETFGDSIQPFNRDDKKIEKQTYWLTDSDDDDDEN